MPVIPPASWSEIEPQIRTGDIMLFFRPGDTGSEILADVTLCPYSHVAMLVRSDLSTPPMLWQEATQSPAPDPVHPGGKAHPGAQLGNARDVLGIMNNAPYSMNLFYRPLDYTRGAAFEAKVMEVVRELDGVPFPSYLTMVLDAAEGRFLNKNSGMSWMFCAQLVAKTYQMVGLIGEEHPPNWYNQGSFSSYNTTDVVFVDGASWGAIEQAVTL